MSVNLLLSNLAEVFARYCLSNHNEEVWQEYKLLTSKVIKTLFTEIPTLQNFTIDGDFMRNGLTHINDQHYDSFTSEEFKSFLVEINLKEQELELITKVVDGIIFGDADFGPITINRNKYL